MATMLSGIYKCVVATSNSKPMARTNSSTSSIIKRNAVFLTTIFAGAFATNIVFNIGMDSMWDQINKGRQWKDIKQRYMGDQEGGEDDDDE
ncbi:Cytochrome b-c1 complex subunit 9, mitochondrial [Extremus antarcticus]|uniref:Complex III subunit 9 n=1 Tax=Extremus antarcticus TaxID=702011 RepID=A0AAJ0GIP4_9PEZI|nr:Cytochrome b-c1 complex subunit 9, mitochondrial [Extremus antarcticus]